MVVLGNVGGHLGRENASLSEADISTRPGAMEMSRKASGGCELRRELAAGGERGVEMSGFKGRRG
jgi:hypothetical protein